MRAGRVAAPEKNLDATPRKMQPRSKVRCMSRDMSPGTGRYGGVAGVRCRGARGRGGPAVRSAAPAGPWAGCQMFRRMSGDVAPGTGRCGGVARVRCSGAKGHGGQVFGRPLRRGQGLGASTSVHVKGHVARDRPLRRGRICAVHARQGPWGQGSAGRYGGARGCAPCGFGACRGTCRHGPAAPAGSFGGLGVRRRKVARGRFVAAISAQGRLGPNGGAGGCGGWSQLGKCYARGFSAPQLKADGLRVSPSM